MVGNAILKSDLANTVFHKRSILLIFEAEFTESVYDIRSSTELTIGTEKKFPE